MNKILYTSGEFYILQNWPKNLEFSSEYESSVRKSKANKIKIANPELAEDACWRSDDRIGNPISLYNWKRIVLKDNDTFDLPKELSVEVKPKNHAGFLSCCRLDLCNCGEKVAILSKSSSPEIPDSSEKSVRVTFGLQPDHIAKIEAHMSKWEGAIYSDKMWERIAKDIGWHPLTLAVYYFRYLSRKQPPTVAGTSTEPYADFIDGSTYVKTNDSKISNSSEKPDFEKIANELLYSFEHRDYFVLGCEKIWNDCVTPRDKTISDLRDRVKELEDIVAHQGKSILTTADRYEAAKALMNQYAAERDEARVMVIELKSKLPT